MTVTMAAQNKTAIPFGQTIGVDAVLADNLGSIQKDLLLTPHGLKQKRKINKSPSKQAGRLFVDAKSRISIYRTKPPKISLKFCAFWLWTNLLKFGTIQIQ